MAKLSNEAGRAICIDKFRDSKGEIVGYRLKYRDGSIMKVWSNSLKSMIADGSLIVDNLTLTHDGRLADKNMSVNAANKPTENLASMSDYNLVTYAKQHNLPMFTLHNDGYLIGETETLWYLVISDYITEFVMRFKDNTINVNNWSHTGRIKEGATIIVRGGCKLKQFILDGGFYNGLKLDTLDLRLKTNEILGIQIKDIDINRLIFNDKILNTETLKGFIYRCRINKLEMNNIDCPKITSLSNFITESVIKNAEITFSKKLTKLADISYMMKKSKIDNLRLYLNAPSCIDAQGSFYEAGIPNLDLNNLIVSKNCKTNNMFYQFNGNIITNNQEFKKVYSWKSTMMPKQ